MKIRWLSILLLLLVASAAPLYAAGSLADQLRVAAKARYPGRPGEVPLRPGMSAYRIVPYQNKYFAYTSGWNSSDTALCAVWEYLNGRWHFVFEHGAGGAIEGNMGNYLDPLYARYGFSSNMRRKLTGGPIHDF